MTDADTTRPSTFYLLIIGIKTYKQILSLDDDLKSLSSEVLINYFGLDWHITSHFIIDNWPGD